MKTRHHIYKFFIIIFFLISSFISYSQDEFKPFEADTTSQNIDEFSEFKEFNEDSSFTCKNKCSGCSLSKNDNSSIDLSWNSPLVITIIAIGLTIIAGFLVRYNKTRKLRIVFLLIGLIFFGFYNGACPCMISSFENTILFLRNIKVDWTSMLWFLSLIPVTYIFGKVWCGWVCHLGALQEFLFHPTNKSWFQSEKTAYVLKFMRYVLLIALIIQLLIMGEIFWCKIDPFLGIFNITLNNNYKIISGVLIILLLISSVFSYRPFCRAACPIGIILGWISVIPGASILGYKKTECINCKNCYESCNINAIMGRKKISYLDNKECIACGNCIDGCQNSGIHFVRKNKNNPVILFLRKTYKPKN
jgi:polyferredoxin